MHNGQHLRNAREAAGLSVRKLAEALGVNASQVSRIENGQRSFTTHVARQAELVLGLEVNTLVRHADDLSDNVRALIPGLLSYLSYPPRLAA